MGTPAYECDSCGWEASGYKKKELEDTGWVWHDRKNGVFVMCGDCEEKYAQRRADRAAA